ncbi:PLAC8-domain-containing protein [Dothidotthia symphoricarpi CBS 119687]|uniref:PLAC8-domain-containing protein n=1 Tax=Dothidotthia symphoricarpi CBS 119687 TaxID=1392245 RepID=A0A6A6A5M4_9PLEO|nr:PLAC8-domain-containing protein [Dothidotthia symphoricarpi CBS 119687]KAF2126483.1 PLAC8-domain-containing protein [Dothidotthia symphoricarpi CBS 119687]
MSQQQHQRFSWQVPLQEEAPSYQPPQQPQINTNVPQHNRILSYTQTPIEHRVPSDTSSPIDMYTPIDPRPQSYYPHIAPNQTQVYTPSSHPYDEKPPISPLTPQDGTQSIPFSPVSPIPDARNAPAQHANTWQSNHARQMSNLSPINTALMHQPMPTIPPTPSSQTSSPLPYKAPITPLSASSKRDFNLQPDHANEPYSPHGFSTQTANHHAVFSPDSAHGPNGLDFTLHQPGQIAHPNMDLSNKGAAHEWKHSLCACSGDVSTCLIGLFCPCILYGRTSYRLSQKSKKEDPTDMLSHKTTNKHCMLMGAACGLWWVFPMLQRTRIRHNYKLEGSIGGDCIRGACCCCCVAISNEKEVKEREESVRRWAGPATGGSEVYTKTMGMVYKAQV